MADGKPESFVSRWSRRKLAAAREAVEARTPPPPAVPATPVVAPPAAGPAGTLPAAAAPDLPSVESLTFESDFSAFMRPGVAADVRQAALRKLLRDPRFNAMDGLDVYIDDYSKPSPLDPAIAERLAKALFTPTRVNAEGHAEDVPADERGATQPAAPVDAQAALTQQEGAGAEAPARERPEPVPDVPRRGDTA